MRAITFHEPFDVRVSELREPVLVAPRDAIVRVTATAICGSDLHPYRGHERGLERGTVLGHEFTGVIEALGPALTGLRLGQRVASPFSTNCGDCPACRRGLPARCVHGELFGWVQDGRGLHGGQSERVRVPLADTTLVAVPDAVDDAGALLAGDVFATGSFSAELAGLGTGDRVAVIGCGPVGICAIAAARHRGASEVIAIDRDPARLALAARFCARPLAADAAADDPSAQQLDAVLECVGQPAATRLAYRLLRHGGTLAAVGVHTEAALAITPGELYDKNLSYRAGRCPARRFLPELLARIAAGENELAALFSHRLPLAAGPEAYRMFDERRDACTKVMLVP